MPMNEYGEIVRETRQNSSQSPNSGNTSKSGCLRWFVIIMIVYCLLGWCLEAVKNQYSTQNDSREEYNTYAQNDKEIQYSGPVWLTDLDYSSKYDVSVISSSYGTSNMGDSYSHYMYGKSSYGEIEYEINGKFSTLTAIWTICEQNKDTTDYNAFEIYADGTCVYRSPSLTGGDKPVTVRADINNCDNLKIMFTEGSGAGELGNIKLQ